MCSFPFRDAMRAARLLARALLCLCKNPRVLSNGTGHTWRWTQCVYGAAARLARVDREGSHFPTLKLPPLAVEAPRSTESEDLIAHQMRCDTPAQAVSKNGARRATGGCRRGGGTHRGHRAPHFCAALNVGSDTVAGDVKIQWTQKRISHCWLVRLLWRCARRPLHDARRRRSCQMGGRPGGISRKQHSRQPYPGAAPPGSVGWSWATCK